MTLSSNPLLQLINITTAIKFSSEIRPLLVTWYTNLPIIRTHGLYTDMTCCATISSSCCRGLFVVVVVAPVISPEYYCVVIIAFLFLNCTLVFYPFVPLFICCTATFCLFFFLLFYFVFCCCCFCLFCFVFCF